MSKELLSILEVKLEHDKRSFKSEILEIIDDVPEDELKLNRYNRLRGAIDYADDLLRFIEEAISELDK